MTTPGTVPVDLGTSCRARVSHLTRTLPDRHWPVSVAELVRVARWTMSTAHPTGAAMVLLLTTVDGVDLGSLWHPVSALISGAASSIAARNPVPPETDATARAPKPTHHATQRPTAIRVNPACEGLAA